LLKPWSLALSATKMFYYTYLEGLCRRRQWSDPKYEFQQTWDGIACIVLVNNLKYRTEKLFATADLARENAAKVAYFICRNQSVNNGQYPSGHDHGGMVQGVPEAIGSGRNRHSSNSSQYSSSDGSRSGGSSPESRDRARLTRVYARR